MAEMAGDGGGERQPERRQADHHLWLKGEKLLSKIGGQRFQHLKRSLIDDERGQRVLAIRQRPDRQADLAPVIQFRRKKAECGPAVSNVRGARISCQNSCGAAGDRAAGDADCGIVLFLSGAGWRKTLALFGHASPVLHIRHFNNRKHAAGSFHWLFQLEQNKATGIRTSSPMAWVFPIFKDKL